MNPNRKNGVLLEGGELDFNKILNLAFYEDLPENMKEMVNKAGFKLDEKGFVVTLEGKDITYDELEELSHA